MSRVCHKLDRSRAAYYKQEGRRSRQMLEGRIVEELVMEQRYAMPRLGGKKLYHLLRPELEKHHIKMGRDRFFDWLRNNRLLVVPKKSFTKTTNSGHRFRVHENLLKGMDITRPDQVWVSDITYLRLQKGFCYLALITDAYSRKIIGHDVSNSLELEGCMRALKMASGNRQGKDTVHHSDRGIQYCSNPYVQQLRDNHILISMAEAGNCYENAMAERVNGILKGEFNLDATFLNTKLAQDLTKQAIRTYNARRPHLALHMQKPDEVYGGKSKIT